MKGKLLGGLLYLYLFVRPLPFVQRYEMWLLYSDSICLDSAYPMSRYVLSFKGYNRSHTVVRILGIDFPLSELTTIPQNSEIRPFILLWVTVFEWLISDIFSFLSNRKVSLIHHIAVHKINSSFAW